MISGKEYTAEELFQEAYKDALFYRRNTGGVTLSGGEVLMQHEVAAELLRMCKRNYMHTCIETSAFSPWEHLQQVAQYCDLIFVDLKHMDSTRHKALTGVGNERVLENIQRLCAYAEGRELRVIVRIPIIPGHTDEADNLRASAAFVATLPGTPDLNLLPYHSLGEKKYEMIGAPYALNIQSMLGDSSDLMLRLRALCKAYAPETCVTIGGGEIRMDGS